MKFEFQYYYPVGTIIYTYTYFCMLLFYARTIKQNSYTQKRQVETHTPVGNGGSAILVVFAVVCFDIAVINHILESKHCQREEWYFK